MSKRPTIKVYITRDPVLQPGGGMALNLNLEYRLDCLEGAENVLNSTGTIEKRVGNYLSRADVQSLCRSSGYAVRIVIAKSK